ncbi:MAG: NAD-dependent epimerase/dehydratase family protein, partial [Deltaproteobacteria bacterium]|nr:NAD-dependent epimerase/dehydratase family protein [Deltaproteobacteria bacterium]
MNNVKLKLIYSLPERDLEDLLTINPSPWEKLRNANVFMTGGTGVFSYWMLSSLLYAIDTLNLKTKITLLIRDVDKFQRLTPAFSYHTNIKILRGNVLNFEFPHEKFTHFVHLAAPSAKAQHEDPLLAFDVLVAGARRVLELAAYSSPESFLYVSTGAVYGRHRKSVSEIDENFREAPDTLGDGPAAYDEGKRAG